VNYRARAFLITLVLLPVLQSCAVSSPQAKTPMQTFSSVSAEQAPELETLAEGDSVIFYSGLLAPFGEVTIGREYTAASGRLCKRIHSASGNELLSIACRARKEHWYLRQLP